MAGQSWPNNWWGIVMKIATASADRLKRKKPAKSKSVATLNIAQRYMELLRLRGQVHELEGKQRSSE
jgi:hypothetical protein